MSWDAYRRMFDHFYASVGQPEEEERFERIKGLLSFDALAHCDVDFSKRRIAVAPPCLAALPVAGLPKAVLCGARGPDIASIARAAQRGIEGRIQIEISSQRSRNPYAPTRIEVEGDSEEDLRGFAAELQIAYLDTPTAWVMVDFSGSLGDYVKTLAWSAQPELSWRRQDFDINRLQFRNPTGESAHFRLSRYQDPVRSTWTYRLWRGEESAEVDVSWGRFVLLNAESRQVLKHDMRTLDLEVPGTIPLPRLMARALTLCSGCCATTSGQISARQGAPRERVDRYDSVPTDVFQVLARKLGQAGPRVLMQESN